MVPLYEHCNKQMEVRKLLLPSPLIMSKKNKNKNKKKSMNIHLVYNDTSG